MGILDRFKKIREDDEDEDSQDGDEEPDDEESGRGGLRGRLGVFRGIGGNAAGILGKVLKRGGDDDDDEDEAEDEVTRLVVAAPSAATTVPPAEPDVSSSADESSDEDDEIPLAVGALVTVTGTGNHQASGKVDLGKLFVVKMEADLALRDLAMSQDAVTARQLADDLVALLGQLAHSSQAE